MDSEVVEAEDKIDINELDEPVNGKPNEVCASTEMNSLDPDDLKVKVEIEFKEEADGLVYEADFRGRLQLVKMNEHASTELNTEDPNPDIEQWGCIPNPLPTELIQGTVIESDQNEQSTVTYDYRQLQNASCDVPHEECTENSFQGSTSTLPAIYNCSLNGLWDQQPVMSHQNTESRNSRHRKVHTVPFTLAEKKRSYRMRIKQENPDLWSAIKQKEACKKREQREERRLILVEMQRTMELISHSENETSEMENQKAYLQALKERYPELWNQLIEALSAAEMRKNELMLEANSKNSRRLTKPITMYKDIVEAQKKYIYRQRIKEEKPEKYAELKARNTYAKSLKRMMEKKKSCPESNGNAESDGFVFNG